MTVSQGGFRLTPTAIITVLFLAALFSAAIRLSTLLPVDDWWQVLVNPDLNSYAQVLVHDSVLPRFVIALVAGGVLGLSGAIFQQVLRTPLADPSTLGVSAGAYLALAVAGLGAPALAASGRELIALAGGLTAFALVFLIAWPHRLSPIALILAGLVITFVCGAISAAISLSYSMGMNSLFVWASGSLTQNDWSAVARLLPYAAFGCIGAALLARPLSVLSLSDEGARSLGLSLSSIRLLSILLAVMLAAFTVSAVGVIGFVGFAAPFIARASGARRLPQRLIASMIIGAALLLAADEALQQATRFMREIPAGAATGLLGAPLIAIFLRRLPVVETPALPAAERRNHRPLLYLAVTAMVMLAMIWISLSLGPSLDGWHFASPWETQSLLIWRLPRLAAAAAAGILFALSGTVIQRITGNPMASPEVIGVNTGAALGILLLVLLAPSFTPLTQLGSAAAGAVVGLVAVLLMGRRSHYNPNHVLLFGIAINTAFAALIAVLLGTGLPKVYGVLQWLAGSTYSTTPLQAMIAVTVAVVLLAIAPFFSRWLDLLPLGALPSRALGLNVSASRATLLFFSAISAAAATLLIGPLSFVGLMAPHIARTLGFQRALPHMIAAAMAGAALTTLADFIGRVALFPNQLPVGIVTTLIGGPYFLWLMRKPGDRLKNNCSKQGLSLAGTGKERSAGRNATK
ncbi:Fe(3+)-hydroxamate ABC transporter permease FhuB [Rhizobium sp. YK2]|uniref:Fe(3+)-hydroxamate ABC transporter permease FhuB n=1 Tax=Rhizobium sp. YK2 TaxID=1860096 RepID=UPI00084CB348|nr:Fe(3+)-hydroxamate ABC transporter permease FhuB [Rhizobium sp. YK2]OEC94330.1 Fe3+-hydroxamate ABC transporter permease FhuB [Rhizobium sp. YK2]